MPTPAWVSGRCRTSRTRSALADTWVAGRAILPPMPIPVYNNLTDADLEAVFAYLRTIPPISNRVPEPWAPAAPAK